MNIFIGNLSYSSTEDAIRALFESYGEVESVKIITDRETGRSRGFGFIEIPNEEEARAAISGLDGSELDGRTIKVNEARPREERSGRGSSGQRW